MYQCSYCQRSYVWEDGLRRHIKTKHTLLPNDVKFTNATIYRNGMTKSCEFTSHTLEISHKPIVFQHPFTMTISGPTGSGKTMLLKELLQKDKIMPSPDRIVYLYKRWQPLYDQMQEILTNIEFMRGIPEKNDEDSFFDLEKNNIVICDDMMSVTAADPKIADLYTEGSHHRNLSVINLTQNLFPIGKNAVTQRRNTQYMIIFKSPMSQDQIRTLGTYMIPGRLDEFLHLYDEATRKPYGYLVIDAKQTTPFEERFKTNIFLSKHPTTETQCKNDSTSICDQGDDGVRFYCNNCKYIHKNEDVFDKHKCDQSEALEEGIKHESLTKTDHLVMNLSKDNMMESNYPCAECGDLFDTPRMLYRHIKQCGEDNTDEVWKRMLEEVFEDTEAVFNRKIEEYAAYDDANKRARRAMKHVYKTELKAIFKKYFIFAQLLESNEMYDQILEDFHTLQFEKHCSREKALKYAIRKNDVIFDQVLDKYIDYADETDEEYNSDE